MTNKALSTHTIETTWLSGNEAILTVPTCWPWCRWAEARLLLLNRRWVVFHGFLPNIRPSLSFCVTPPSHSFHPPFSPLLVTRTHCFLFHLKYLQKEIVFLLCFLYLYKKNIPCLQVVTSSECATFFKKWWWWITWPCSTLKLYFFGEKEDIASSSVIWLKGIEREEYEWDKCEGFMTWQSSLDKGCVSFCIIIKQNGAFVFEVLKAFSFSLGLPT